MTSAATSIRRAPTSPPATSRSASRTSAKKQFRTKYIISSSGDARISAALPSPELVSAALTRRVFAMLLGVALIASVVLCAYASRSPDALISFRTAMQIGGWLCLVAVLVGFCARVARHRRHLGEVTVAATTFFIGAAMLYLSYFQWSELPTAPESSPMAKTAPGIWNPAAHRAPLPIASPARSASAGGSPRHVARVAASAPRIAEERPVEPLVAVAAVPVAAVPVADISVADVAVVAK